ncbi:hypothetical protein HZI70_15540 [Lactiplantibacillus plantarum]|uniref:hypothetical protein n=1 Tax=Lactiplantibacillus plantarum TaxID=1590 RepID=UPI001FCD1282|nr:hypothetical protein [Lactiplantibacillus plantarum]MCJ2385484.1 hypothetical protein [Lactiplantibacillus plantarum]
MKEYYSIISLDKWLLKIREQIKEKIHEDGLSEKEFRTEFHTIVNKILKDKFTVAHDNEVLQDFILNKMVNCNEHCFSKSYFLVGNGACGFDSDTILGLTTIRIEIVDIKDLDKSVKKKLIVKGKSPNNVNQVPTFLIDQVAKNDLDNNPVNGQDIITVATTQIRKSLDLIGGAVVTLHAIMPSDSNHHRSIVNIYEECGFKTFGDAQYPNGYEEPDSNEDREVKVPMYQPMFLRLIN